MSITLVEGKLLTHWGRVTHICVRRLTIMCSDNGLVHGRHQAIIWTGAGILLIRPLATNFSEISTKILTFPLTKIRFKMSSAKCCPFRIGLNVLTVLCWINFTKYQDKLTLAECRLLKSFCRWIRFLCRQDTSNHDMDLFIPKYCSFCRKMVKQCTG